MIPLDKIKQAKENLNEKAAQIIARGMNLQKWSERELKGCCPFHQEKTPSFIWDKKHYCFKCFGCGKTLDIVEYYTEYEHLSFIESIEKLFKEAGVSYDFESEKSKHVVREFKKPKEEKAEPENIVKSYMSLRKIGEDTLKYAGVKQDNKNNIVFEYYDQYNQLLLVKYRPARQVKKGGNKLWCQKNADTKPVLYGMHQVDPTKPVLIIEGEMDRLACIESGFKNVVSVPFGAGNYTWIEYNWKWLEQIPKIILWSDNDEAGEKMRKEVIPRLGEERCYVVKSKYKDANIHLYREGKESVLKSINEAEIVPLPDTMELFDAVDFDINKAAKIKTCFKGLNRYIGGFVLPTVNIITGINSSGKSTLVNQMCIAEPLEQGYKTWIFSGELPPELLKNWIQFPLAGPQNIREFDNGPDQPRGYAVYRTIKTRIKKCYQHDVLYYTNEDDMSASTLLKRMEQVARQKGIKNFVLDSLMMIDLECSQYELNLKQKEFVLKLKKFTRKFNCVVHLIVHPRKVDMIRRLTKLDVCGSGDITNLSDYVMSIHRVQPSEKEEKTNKKGEVVTKGCPFDAILDLFKNRPLGFQDKSIGLYFDYKSKRYYGDDDDLNKYYKWNKTEIPLEEMYEEVEEKAPWD